MRVLECLTYLHSLCYFFFVIKTNKAFTIFITVVYEIVIIAFIVCSAIALRQRSASKCNTSIYGNMTLALSIIEIICGCFMVFGHISLMIYFIIHKTLPNFIIGVKGGVDNQKT